MKVYTVIVIFSGAEALGKLHASPLTAGLVCWFGAGMVCYRRAQQVVSLEAQAKNERRWRSSKL